MSSEKKSRRSSTRNRTTPIPAAEKDSSSDELIIDVSMATEPDQAAPPLSPALTRASSSTPKASPEKRPAPSTRKKRRRPRSSSSSTADDLEDQTFEETIERCASKNNLTPDCVKKLLKKLVMNEHVLAIVKLKEEEEQKCKGKQSTTTSKDGTDGDDEDDELKSLQPKLTRLKAKQLNKQPLPIVPLKTPLPDEEVARLIREELNSDDDDEEYKPTEEDIPSDDDPNTTISDIDSQPRTPAAPTTPGRIEQDSAQDASMLYSKDGLFKIPRLRNDSHCSQQSEQEQENIARRTRSKLCLQTTAIETIESTFIPPDITTDMYDFDCDMDLVWKEFLNEFTKPLENHAEDDDDTDPEYVAADKIPIDREELREVKVSKKELNELVSELIEMSGIIDESFLDNAFGDDAQQKDTNQQNLRSGLNTPGPKEHPEQEQSSSAVSSVDHATFQPTNSSTPTATVQAVSRIPVVAAQTIQCPNSFGTTDNTPVVAAIQPLAVVPPVQSVYPSSYQRASTNGQFVAQVATPDKSSYYPYHLPSDNVPVIRVDPTNELIHIERRYRYLHNLHPVQVQFPEGQTGFTDFQLQILQQQLRIHTQFAAQNFMQCYAHPKFWEMANTFKKMLTDLKDVKAFVRPWNLNPALECCLSWEAELDKPSAENTKFMNFLIKDAAESEKGDRNYNERRTFHPKLMEKVVNSKAFMYPKLLPCTPFRAKPTTRKRICSAEERLIAFGLELFFEIRKAERSKWHKHAEAKVPSLKQVSYYISKYLCPNYTEDHIYDYCTRHKRYSYLNPIKYYFLHSKAPPYQHVLEAIDLKNVIPPALYQKDQLPTIWEKYVYSEDRVAKLNGHPDKSKLPLRPLPASAKRHLPSAKDSNVNITISVILDPKQEQQQPGQPAPPDVATDGSTFQINQQFLDQSYHPVKPVREGSSLASDVAKFKQDSSQKSIEVVELDQAQDDSVNTGRVEGSSLSSSRKCCGCDCHERSGQDCGTSPQTLLKGQKRLTEYFQRTPSKKEEEVLGKKRLKDKLWRIYGKFWDLHRTRTDFGLEKLKKVQRHCELIVGFSHFLEDLEKMSANQAVKNPDPVILTNGAGHKFMKVDHSEEKDASYAYNFFEKVEETLLAENKHAQHEKFLEILQSFNEKEDRVADLYRKIEELFLGEHPELCDLFLTFLLPGQAAEVGKFFEHFILTNANDFLAKLNIYFAKQPSQIKKIYSSLNDLSNEPNVSMEQIKARILPLLKGNPFLIEWFIQLFPEEKPPESNNLSDYEAISMKKLPLPDYSDPNEVYEDVPFVEMSPEPTVGESTVCGTKYIQGRIMYGTLPARLSFLANDCTTSQTSKTPEEGPLKGCVHVVRTVEKSKTTSAGGVAEGGEDKDIPADVSVEEARDEQLRYKLCDDAAFKAHAIRLNPLVHGGKGVNYADVAHLLVPDPETSGESNNHPDEDKPTSPKKQQQSKTTLPKKRINSPVSKKPGTAGKNSPTTAKKTPASIPADSKVISVSKKLKSMVEAPPASSSEVVGPESSLPAKRKPPSTPNATIPAVPAKKEKPLKKHPDEQLEEPEQQQVAESKEKEQPQQQQVVAEEPSWTRDEDKVILEEIKNGYSSVEELVERIGARIEGRSEGQIRTRYEFLMEVLKKFQKTT